MKLKIPKSFNTDKWLQKLEPNARHFMWMFGMLLAMATVLNILNTLPLSLINRLILIGLLILSFPAALITFLSDLRQSSKQKIVKVPTDLKTRKRNKWILIWFIVLAAIILVPILARQRLPDPQEYQTFLTAFAGVGAWVIGIALASVAYQQYKLRETEHNLLFEPHILLKSLGTPITGALAYNNIKYPYRIEWSILILNSSERPVMIDRSELRIRCSNEEPSNGVVLPPTYCYILEPEELEPQFQVTLSMPKRIRWIIEGEQVGNALNFNGNANNQGFELIFKIHVTLPQNPNNPFIMEIVSDSFLIPHNAKWGAKINFTW